MVAGIRGDKKRCNARNLNSGAKSCKYYCCSISTYRRTYSRSAPPQCRRSAKITAGGRETWRIGREAMLRSFLSSRIAEINHVLDESAAVRHSKADSVVPLVRPQSSSSSPLSALRAQSGQLFSHFQQIAPRRAIES